METLALTIRDLTSKGYGVAAEKPLEVAHTVPGDQVLVQWKKKRHPPQKGRLLEVILPSADRVEPRCVHAGICGGCSWQQMSYDAQLRVKEERVRSAFQSPVSPILPSPRLFGYRNKMEFSFSENRAGAKFLGLMIAQAEPYVFNVETCHLCPPWFNAVLAEARVWWETSNFPTYNPRRGTEGLRYLTLRQAFRTEQKMVVLNISGHPDAPSIPPEQIDAFVLAVQRALSCDCEAPAIFLRIHQTQKGRPTQFVEVHLSGPDHIVEELKIQDKTLSFQISPASFFQPNTLAAEVLFETVLSFLEPCSLVYDLYSGTGVLGMVAAMKAGRVIGMEMSPEAVQDAKKNLQRNQMAHVTLYQGDVGSLLTKLSEQPDAVLLDPPRAGLDPLALRNLKALRPKRIVYVSCNPLTQSENVRQLEAVGYRVEALQPVDQFPHTYHIENIALLSLS